MTNKSNAMTDPTAGQELGEQARSFLTDISQSGKLPPGVTPGHAAAIVLSTFARRVTAGEAQHLREALPEELRGLLDSDAMHASQPPERFDRDQFVRRVSSYLGIKSAAAEHVAHAVFDALKHILPAREANAAASQLPADLKTLWRGV